MRNAEHCEINKSGNNRVKLKTPYPSVKELKSAEEPEREERRERKAADDDVVPGIRPGVLLRSTVPEFVVNVAEFRRKCGGKIA
jgi:hypothetical protein